jgi:cephalosporin hydroxylase
MSERVIVDTEKGEVTVERDGHQTRHPMASPEAFEAVSRAWLRCGWDAKYVYSFSWLGRPIIQLPEDMVRLQELITEVQPAVIVETGVAHGGSLVLWASLCRALDHGRVIGVDIEIRPHNREALEAHVLAPLITLIEGSSTDPEIVARVRSDIGPDEPVFVILDSNHTKEHVLGELEAYAPLIGPGSYIVAMDGIMGDLAGAPRTSEDWSWNNPRVAVEEFVSRHPEFEVASPPFPFNEGAVRDRVTYGPGGIVRRRS